MATYASLLTLERNIQEQMIHGDHGLKPLHEKVNQLLEIMGNCSQATPREDFEVRIRHYAYEASNVIEVHFLPLTHRRRDEERCFSPLVFFFDVIWTWMHSRCTHHKLRKLIDEGACLVVEARELTDGVTNHPPMTTIMQLKEPSSSSSSSSAHTPKGAKNEVPLYLKFGKLKDRLYSVDKRQREVIPIVGMGGSGKTTLADSLFKDSRTRKHFHCHSWITVSQNYDMKTVLKQILQDLKQPENCEDEEDILGLAVYQTLKKRRYFIVIDNVWSEEFWDRIERVLPDDTNGSRILLTTRNDNVATYVVTSASESYIHKVEFMDLDTSWNLLKDKVFGQGEHCPTELTDVGKKIAKDCGGLPLAIVVIAGVLSDTNMKKDLWKNVAADVNTAIKKSSSSDGEVAEILCWSYINLPHHLKPCFLYLACFPAYYNIEVSKLIMLWVAEGFLKVNRHGRSQEEVAYNYLDDLVKKSLVLVSKKNYDGKIELCYLHEQIRSMCVDIAEKENFVCQINGGWKLSLKEIQNKIRFSIYSEDFVIDYRRLPNGQIRSTHYFPIGWRSDSYRVLLPKISNLLQVLDAGDITFSEFPYQVCQLHLLKYLALRIKEDLEVSVVEVPSRIIKLRNLQVFRVQGFDGLKIKLPLEIWEMTKLRHLTFFGKAVIPDPPTGTSSSLENLQTLCSLVDFTFTDQVVQMIPNVKVLDIEYNDGSDDYCLQNLLHLANVETLKISKGIPTDDIQLPRNLKHLTLSWCRFPWSRIGEVVGSLLNLEVMKLKDNACDGDEWAVKEGEFPQLKVLEIDETDLILWKCDDEDAEIFPSLERLSLYNCDFLRELPSCIGEIHTLTLIKVNMRKKNELLVKWIRKFEEEQKSNANDDLKIIIQEE